MAAPNIVNVSTINGSTDVQVVSTTLTAITTNATSSGKVYKVNSLYVSNVDGVNDAAITATLTRGSTNYAIVNTVTVPADSTIMVISNPFYMEEGDIIKLQSSASSSLEAVCSYEDIS